MLKIGLWLALPPFATFVFSPPPVRLEYAVVIFVLALIALLVGIVPRIGHPSR